ncbi:hypothetical protein A1F96_03024 [Pyrenophora tritici-repentis]|nr:hypothetical protein PtrSN001A_000220 [Pyrenophora tritici-repentis]KAI1580264.1 hypothetical protein PtrEW4_000012 [Pyrenophora tritici-repentis]PZD05226.1 hypothetical protein A1F95_00164 [Pyrenophora tritici-repentis]PZD32280.1 hypothetical protein A1F96_03024 [Pyrenophora tritici-repentis]
MPPTLPPPPTLTAIPPHIDTTTTNLTRLTGLYINGPKKIPLAFAYPLIKSLLRHPPCLHRSTPTSWPCGPCEGHFTAHYWACAAVLLDYFSDFFWRDSAHMQALWFYLLDIWQEKAAWLPCEAVFATATAWRTGLLEMRITGIQFVGVKVEPWVLERAIVFESHVRETIDLIEKVVWGRKGKASTGPAPDFRLMRIGQDAYSCNSSGGMESDLSDRVIYDPNGKAYAPSGNYETGPWVSGVKPWLQFLGVGGPGVGVNDAGTANSNQEEGKTTITRYVPQSAIAIMKYHTKRTSYFATRLDIYSPDDPDGFHIGVEDNSLAFPEVWKVDEHSYVSQLTGCKTTYSLRNGAPLIVRHRGWGDVDLAVKNPDLVLDEGEVEEEEEEPENVFDMWTVVESTVQAESGSGGGDESGQVLLDLGPMFDNWCGPDEVDEF